MILPSFRVRPGLICPPYPCRKKTVESGGNVEGSKVGETVVVHGVKIIGHKNAAGRLAADASALYSRNLFNLINAFWDKDGKTADWKADDEIVKGIKLTEGGAVVHERLQA